MATEITAGSVGNKSHLTLDSSRFNLKGLGVLLFYGLLLLGLYDGWVNRWDNYFIPDRGIGYMLGIIGGVMVLLMLVFSVKKRYPRTPWLGSTKLWFRAHMIMGVLAPSVILYHANFSFGSLNSTVALICMLLVAASGLVGRYFYTKVHKGLYGKRKTLVELRDDMADAKNKLNFSPKLLKRLDEYEQRVMASNTGLGSSISSHFMINTEFNTFIKGLKKRVATELCDGKSDVKRLNRVIDQYKRKLQRVSGFQMYERLFSLWHVVHIPFFLMLILSGVVHVFAVHYY